MHPVRALVEAALSHWPGTWEDASDPAAPHEAGLLSLGIERARADLGYVPRWGFADSVRHSMEWYRDVAGGVSPLDITAAQIAAFGAP